MPNFSGKYFPEKFRPLVLAAVEANRVADAASNESFSKIFDRILTADVPDTSDDSLLEATLDVLTHEVGQEDPSLREREQQAQLDARLSTNALVKYLVEVAQTDRAQGIFLAQLALRYTFAKCTEKSGVITGIRLLSGNLVASSLFRELSTLINSMTRLETRTGCDDSGNIHSTSGSTSPPLSPGEWRRAASAVFDLARRQQPSGATHFTSVARWEKILEQAPEEIARPLALQAQRRVTKYPGHSPELIATVHRVNLQLG